MHRCLSAISTHRTTLLPALIVAALSGCIVNPVPTPASESTDRANSADVGATGGQGADASGNNDNGATEPGAGDCTPKKADTAPTQIGGSRPAEVLLPKSWNGCAKRPLVILLHGYSASGLVQDIYLGISAARDKHDFVMVRPEGTMAPNGKQFWNATPFCCDFFKQNPDDVGYIKGLIEESIAKLAVDPARVYLIGHSNGGFMSYRFACEHADMVTGIASLAGAVTPTESACKPSAGVHVLQMHGTKDKTIKYAGAAGYPSAEEAVARWRKFNACADEFDASEPLDYDGGTDGKETTRYKWKTCKDGATVGLWKMVDSQHVPGVNGAFKEALLTEVLSWKRTKK